MLLHRRGARRAASEALARMVRCGKDVANKRKKKDAGSQAEAPKRDRKVKPIRLKDLLPRQDVTGGKKSLFGTRDQDTNRADGSTRED